MEVFCLLYTGTLSTAQVAKRQGSEMRKICVLILLFMSCMILIKLWKLSKSQFLYL